MGEIDKLSDYVKQAQSLLSRLNETQEAVECVNQEENHFGWEITNYPLMDQVYINCNLL